MECKITDIIKKTGQLFKRCGIKSQSMAAIASNAGISSKTLYKFVKDKNEIVTKVVDFEVENQHDIIRSIVEKNLDALEESAQISATIVNHLTEVSEILINDLEKYYPELFYDKIKDKDRAFIIEVTEQNLAKGIKEGVYRSDIKTDIITANYLAMLNMTFSGGDQQYKNRSMLEMYKETFKYHLNGIVNDENRDKIGPIVKNIEL